MGSDYGVLVFFVCGDQFVQKAEELVYLRLREVSVVCCVFYFESIGVVTFACHDVWERVKTWVAYRNADRIIVVFLQQLDKNTFAVETAFAPSAECDLVDFLHGNSSSSNFDVFGASCDKRLLQDGLKRCVWVMLLYTPVPLRF